LGPIFLENNLEKLTNSLNLLITKEAKCLAAVDEDDEDVKIIQKFNLKYNLKIFN